MTDYSPPGGRLPSTRPRPDSDPPGRWTAGRCVLWLAVCLMVCFLFLPRYVRALKPPTDKLVDFFQEWSSARNAFSGIPVYAPIDVAVEAHLGLRKIPDSGWDINVHPPTSVLLAFPFQVFDYPTAFVLWNIVSLVALAAAAFMIARGLGVRLSPWSALPLFCLALIAEPLYQQLLQGQLNLILLLLIVSVWFADRSGKPYLAGALLGLAVVIKLFPVFLIVYFLLRRDVKAVLATLLSIVLLTGLTAAVLGTDTMRTYVTEVMPQATTWKAAWNNASLTGFWHKLFAPGGRNGELTPLLYSPALAMFATAVSSLIVIGLLAPRIWRASTTSQRDQAFALCVTAMLLVSPVTWEHYFLLLLLPLTLVWLKLPETLFFRVVKISVLIVLCLPIIGLCNLIIPGGFWSGHATPWHALTLMAMQCYALCALFALGFHAAVPRDGFTHVDRPNETVCI